MQATVVGAGSWGTALGAVLAGKGWPVAIWDIDPVPLAGIGTAVAGLLDDVQVSLLAEATARRDAATSDAAAVGTPTPSTAGCSPSSGTLGR